MVGHALRSQEAKTWPWADTAYGLPLDASVAPHLCSSKTDLRHYYVKVSNGLNNGLKPLVQLSLQFELL